MNRNSATPRNERTPSTEAGRLLDELLASKWSNACDLTLAVNQPSTLSEATALFASAEDPHVIGQAMLRMVCGHIGEAMRAEKAGRYAIAWTHVIDAQRFIGIALGLSIPMNNPKPLEPAIAKMRAAERHAPGNSAKEWVRSEYEQHRPSYKSKADFARIYVKRLLNERSLTVTEKTLKEDWLKGL